jgi:uroporphyrinogen-III decarboxylase
MNTDEYIVSAAKKRTFYHKYQCKAGGGHNDDTAMCIVGGMPNSLLKGGTAEEVRQLTIRLCKEVCKDGGFVMTTGVGEMEGCRPELVKVWVETTKEFGVYK